MKKKDIKPIIKELNQVTIEFTIDEVKELYNSLECVEADIEQEMLEDPKLTLLKSTYALLDGIRKLRKQAENTNV